MLPLMLLGGSGMANNSHTVQCHAPTNGPWPVMSTIVNLISGFLKRRILARRSHLPFSFVPIRILNFAIDAKYGK
jgi:hypothetical protein